MFDRKEAIDFALDNKTSTLAVQLLTEALSDSVIDIRIAALKSLQPSEADAPTLTKIATIATNDPRRLARAAAISLLGRTGNPASFCV